MFALPRMAMYACIFLMRNNSTSRTNAACCAFVSRMISRVMRVCRNSMSGIAPTRRAARINSTENSSGTSIMSSRTRSPFFSFVEYSASNLARVL